MKSKLNKTTYQRIKPIGIQDMLEDLQTLLANLEQQI